MENNVEANSELQELFEEDLDDDYDQPIDLGDTEAIFKNMQVTSPDPLPQNANNSNGEDGNSTQMETTPPMDTDTAEETASGSTTPTIHTSATQCTIYLDETACKDPRCANPDHNTDQAIAQHREYPGESRKIINLSTNKTTISTQVTADDLFLVNTEDIVSMVDAQQQTSVKRPRSLTSSSQDLIVSTGAIVYKPKAKAAKHADRSNNNNNTGQKDTQSSSSDNKKAPSVKKADATPTTNKKVTIKIPSLIDINTTASFDTAPPEPTDQKKKIKLILPADLEDYKINSEAKEAWKSSKSYRANQQRARMRADQVRQLLENDCVPSCYLGANSLPRFLLPLSETMATTIRRHGVEKAQLAIEYLEAQSQHLKRRADNALLLCKQIYQEEGDTNFEKAALIIKYMVSH